MNPYEPARSESLEKPVLLAVDDRLENIDVLRCILDEEYEIEAAGSGQRALDMARTSPPDMVLLDIRMPDMDGYEVCSHLKADPRTADIPVIFVTALDAASDEAHGLELGAVDYIAKPITPAIVSARIKTHLAMANQARYLEDLVQQRTQKLNETRREIIRCLGQASEFKDNETGMHIMRMSHYSQAIARAMDLDEKWIELLYHAAPMHDVGKIGIPDAVLLKPGRLNAEEWEVMKQHPAFGAAIIGDHPSPLLQMARDIALGHHEKWDGSGYPQGLGGEAIPLAARIVAVADVFDALTSERPYKAAWEVVDAVEEIRAHRGQHFDPRVCDAFLSVVDQLEGIRCTYADSGVSGNLFPDFGD